MQSYCPACGLVIDRSRMHACLASQGVYNTAGGAGGMDSAYQKPVELKDILEELQAMRKAIKAIAADVETLRMR